MHRLSDLMIESDRAAFLRCFERKTRWRGRVSCGERVATLLSWGMLESALCAPGFPAARLRIMLAGQRVGPACYVDAESGAVRGDAVQALAQQGATLVIDGVSTVVGSLAGLSRGIERDLSGNVNCSAYLSFGEDSAFLPHYDDHDVLIIHLEGSKSWRGYGHGLRFPIGRGPTQRVTTPDWEDVLEAGDLLYLPRGEIHAAVPVVRPSVHLTIGISERNGIDFVRTLAEAAEAQELFRRSLSRTDTAAQERDLKQALHALVDAASLDTFLAHDDRQRRLKPAAAFNFLARLRPDTLLASTLLRRIDLHTGDPREIKLVLGGQPVRLPQLARRALDQLTRNERSPLDDLAHALDLDPTDPDLAAALDQLAILALIEICE